MVKTEVIDLTPEISERFMSMNTKNRKLSPKLVDSYAKDMKEGRWYANGEPIIISNNVLISGQHRCLAVIKSGVTLKDTVIVYTDEPEMVDTGRVRSVTDLTGIPSLISAAVSTCLAMTIKKHNVSKALISDVVTLDGVAYYVDTFGFKKLRDFNVGKNYKIEKNGQLIFI